MDSGCDCCCNMMWRRLIAKRSHTVHSSSGYKNRRRTSLQHARTPPPPPPPPTTPSLPRPPAQTDIPKICLKLSVTRTKKAAHRDMSFALSYDLSGWPKIFHVCCNWAAQVCQLWIHKVLIETALRFEENRGLLKFWLYLSVLVVFAFLLHGAKKSVIKIQEANRCEYYRCSFL